MYNHSTRYGSIKNSLVRNTEIIFGTDVKDLKIYSISGQLIKTSSVKTNETLNVPDLKKGNYIITVTVNNQPVPIKF